MINLLSKHITDKFSVDWNIYYLAKRFIPWWLLMVREKTFDGFPLQHAWVRVNLLSSEQEKLSSLALSRGTRWRIGDQRDGSSRRHCENTGGVRLHRAVWCVGEWRLTVEQCWISPSSDATPVPVCSTNQHSTWTTEHKPRRTGLTVSPIFFFLLSPLCHFPARGVMGGHALLSAWQCGVTANCQEQICLSQYLCWFE